ncbi:uncharacterized protein PODANS_3_8655 [Podospora anserina S mat+]|uniref:Podospora anserina S mat+ genomic DNA chromosome 3, supercontig 2 n=1 Tax=Podospora anserina (strain S / ATCC MYA-4624 / DSM 980 / FGSC 10383) TaxID=515849 RepID=B2B0C4_PODAN|nr:uncharacterized protein PODANS_3_8655 [Podospora anserina S mat+]CAP70805.1 unnamed protein product [Podospora anserina S mat+]CDP27399.1 Putative protein of unknown function [Podospora anserina S mat+]
MSYSTDDQTEATETTGLPLEDRLEEAMTLLDIGLQKLIGVKKSIPGVKVTKSNNDLPSLIGIAPASPSLRRKVEGLMPGDIDPEIWDVDDEIEDEIRKRLWLRCQTGIRSDPIQRISTSQTNADDNRQEEAPQRLLGGPKSAEERCGPPECGEAIINPLHYASTANRLAHYCGIPEGIYDDDNDYDEGYDADDSPSETDSFSPYSSSDIGALHSDDWQGSSEAEYFYTDGQGNVVTLQQDSDSTEPEAVGWDRSSSIDTMDFE